MAQVSINGFDWNKDYYAYVCIGGYECYSGRFRAWKLYSLENPDLCKVLGQHPEEVKALFETEEELNAYIADLHKEPENTGQASLFDEEQLKRIGTGKNKLIISQIL